MDKNAIYDGCGIKGIIDELVPDSLLGLPIEEACLIHDWMYHHGKTKEQRQEADIVFLENMKKLVNESDSNFLTKLFRKGLAKIYYFGVRLFGGFFFNKKEINQKSD